MAEQNEYMTVKEYLAGVSPLVSEDMVKTLMVDKHIEQDAPIEALDERERDLLKADALILSAMSPSTQGGWEEQVGNWKTKQAGNTITSSDRAAMKRMARYLYNKWGEPWQYPSSVRVIRKGMAL